MDNNSAVKKKPSNNTGTKILIASMSLATTFSVWSWLGYRQLQDATNQKNNDPEVGNQDQAVAGLPPLPTLVPLKNVLSVSAQVDSSQPGVVVALREVSAPTLNATPTTRKPIVQQVIIEQPSTNTGGGGGGSHPAARTKSSKR